MMPQKPGFAEPPPPYAPSAPSEPLPGYGELIPFSFCLNILTLILFDR